MIVEPKLGLDVGRVVVDILVENADDLTQVAVGQLPANQVRHLTLQALVDTGTKGISLSTSIIAQLGLRPIRRRQARTAAGLVMTSFYSAVRVTVQNRDCLSDVAEVPDGTPALLGYIPLEVMDYWIDMENKRLAGNPEHGGEWIDDAF